MCTVHLSVDLCNITKCLLPVKQPVTFSYLFSKFLAFTNFNLIA